MVIKDIYNLFDKSDCLMILEKLYNYNFSDSIIHSNDKINENDDCLLYTSPSPRDKRQSRMPSSA